MIPLTDRDRRMLDMLAEGKTNREIGAALGTSRGYAKNLVDQLLSKIGAENRTEAAVWWVRQTEVRR